MDVVENLQQEAEQRARSLEGFLQVIHLVLDNIDVKKIVTPYLLIFRDYVLMQQEILQVRRLVHQLESDGEGRKAHPNHERFSREQKRLSDLIHTARSKSRELPPHVWRKMRQLESRYGDTLYHPYNWDGISEKMEAYVIHSSEFWYERYERARGRIKDKVLDAFHSTYGPRYYGE